MNRLSDEWFSSKSESVPLWHKIALSIDEMYVYTGIGRETIRELTKQPEAKQFILKSDLPSVFQWTSGFFQTVNDR